MPLEGFRKDVIGGVKEKKKQHDKRTAKFCQAQEKMLNLSSKKPETVFVEVLNCYRIFKMKQNFFHSVKLLQCHVNVNYSFKPFFTRQTK